MELFQFDIESSGNYPDFSTFENNDKAHANTEGKQEVNNNDKNKGSSAKTISLKTIN
ncbi:MAG: hypothetical protein RIQ76_393 [Pseudomonadota bacterium]